MLGETNFQETMEIFDGADDCVPMSCGCSCGCSCGYSGYSSSKNGSAADAVTTASIAG